MVALLFRYFEFKYRTVVTVGNSDSKGNETIAMITKLVSNDNRALSFYYNIFLEDTRYMTILTRQERERLVSDLYNQGKTIREIAKEVRMSFRDIGVILNKAV
jgi:hypothetical protein